MNSWIVDWSDITDRRQYAVAPINARDNGELYLGGRLEMMIGWQVKRLRERCYAALEMPQFDPAIVKEKA